MRRGSPISGGQTATHGVLARLCIRDVRVAGITVPDSAVAELALRLHRAGEIALSRHVGRAFDQNRGELDLDRPDLEPILATLEDAPPSLVPIRDALRAAADG
jgi:hypothetical protein